MNSKKKVLLICRSYDHMGGVVNYYKSILKYYDSDNFIIEHFLIGKRPGMKSNFNYILFLFYDSIRLFFKLFDKNYSIVHLNPSLGFAPVARDSIFLLIARLHNKKSLVFSHGWDKKFETLIDENVLLNWFIKKIFNNSDSFVVLATEFKNKLRNWGFKQKIFLETTAVDDSLLIGFTPEEKIEQLRGPDKLKILFFSRIEVLKGVLDVVDAFSSLNYLDRDLELVIAGDGPDYDLLVKRIKEIGDKRIKLIGYVRGNRKRKILETSHLMCLPTYGEGLPSAILEAMAFGMPVITCAVGGIPDVFEEGTNVLYTMFGDKVLLSKILVKLISNKDDMTKMALNNYNLVNNRFLASIVARRLDYIYGTLIKDS